jgi:hypothetical protein
VTAPKSQLQYVLIPHPDDEFAAWSMIEGAADNYPVFILLTHGEATAFADGHGLQVGLGERVPQPQPFHGPHSLFAHAQRLDSWHAFLDRMAALDATLDSPPFFQHLVVDGRGFDVFIGTRTARVVFDLGDGSLTEDDVGWALRTVRANVRGFLPVTQEYGAIGAAYFNADNPGPIYTHPDHRAVHRALWDTDFGLPGPQWGRTTDSDPDVARTSEVTPETYRQAMEVGAGGQRLGAVQQVYGWLGAPAEGFPTTPGDLFARVQAFWQRF